MKRLITHDIHHPMFILTWRWIAPWLTIVLLLLSTASHADAISNITPTKLTTAPALIEHLPEPFNLHTLMSMIGSLAVIIIVLLVVKRLLLRHRGLGHPFQSKHLKVIQTLSFSMREKIVILEIEDNWMIIGITAQGMNTLYTMPKPQSGETTALPETALSFSSYFKSILDRRKTPSSDS